MRRALYRDLKPELQRLAGVTGFGTTDSRFLERFNKATEELMHDGDFPGVVDRYKFNAYDGNITLPGDLERLMGIAVSGQALELRSPWYEFDQSGPGPQEGWTGLDLGLDRGEVATFRDIPEDQPAQLLRIYGEVDERTDAVRPKITLRGYDETGAWVRSQVDGVWVDGQEFELNGDTAPYYIQTPTKWSSIESVIKPVTNGYIRIWAVSDISIETIVAIYSPRETRPSYRRYHFPHIPAGDAKPVIARCRRRFVPVVNDDDWVIFSNLAAMELMMKAVQAREADEFNEYIAKKGAAIELLNREAKSYHGKVRTPAITFTQGFGLGNYPSVR